MCISFSKILSILDNREIGLQLDGSSLESFLWMRITLPVFKLVWNIPVEKDKLHIVARYLDIWFWAGCKILVRILLGPQELLILRDYIILQISSLFLEVIMKELLLFVEKKTSEGIVWKLDFWLNSHNNWCKKSYWKSWRLRLGHWCIFHNFWLHCVINFTFHWH